MFFYVAFSFSIDNLLLIIEKSSLNRYTYAILGIFTVIEYSVFAYFLYSVIEKKAFKVVIVTATIAFYLFSVVYYIKVGDHGFDSLTASIESIFIVTFCIFYLFDQLNKPQVMFIYQDPNFWFVAGFMVYLSGTLFLFIQASELDKEVRQNFWKINLVANITKNILFAIAFSTKKSKSIVNSIENPFEHDFLENPYKS